MHILFLTDNFPPEVNAPASRTFEHCRAWVEAGHQVTVITCVPNFPKGVIFEGYRNRPWQRERMAGIEVIRVWSYIAANKGFARRIFDYLSYMVTATAAAPFVREPDIVIGTSPQFFTACAAWIVGRFKRIPYVFELRDLWPESIRAVGAMKESKALDLLERLELFLYRQADLIVSVTWSFEDDLARRGVDTRSVRVITNGVDADRFRPQPKDEDLVDALGLTGKFVAGYIGTHGMAHGLETVLETAALMQKTPEGRQFRFMFLGDGARKAELVAKSREMGLDNTLFIDSVPKEEVVRYWSLLDVSIIHLKKSDLFKSVIPSKLFECMAMGIPVAHGVEGESARIVEAEKVGLCFEPENPTALKDLLFSLHTDGALMRRLQERGPEAARHYDRSSLAQKMLRELEVAAREFRGKKTVKEKGTSNG